MPDLPEVEQIYVCEKCTHKFKIPLRVESQEGEYNACARCKSLFIIPKFVVEGAGEFDSEFDACRACFKEE